MEQPPGDKPPATTNDKKDVSNEGGNDDGSSPAVPRLGLAAGDGMSHAPTSTSSGNPALPRTNPSEETHTAALETVQGVTQKPAEEPTSPSLLSPPKGYTTGRENEPALPKIITDPSTPKSSLLGNKTIPQIVVTSPPSTSEASVEDDNKSHPGQARHLPGPSPEGSGFLTVPSRPRTSRQRTRTFSSTNTRPLSAGSGTGSDAVKQLLESVTQAENLSNPARRASQQSPRKTRRVVEDTTQWFLSGTEALNPGSNHLGMIIWKPTYITPGAFTPSASKGPFQSNDGLEDSKDDEESGGAPLGGGSGGKDDNLEKAEDADDDWSSSDDDDEDGASPSAKGSGAPRQTAKGQPESVSGTPAAEVSSVAPVASLAPEVISPTLPPAPRPGFASLYSDTDQPPASSQSAMGLGISEPGCSSPFVGGPASPRPANLDSPALGPPPEGMFPKLPRSTIAQG